MQNADENRSENKNWESWDILVEFGKTENETESELSVNWQNWELKETDLRARKLKNSLYFPRKWTKESDKIVIVKTLIKYSKICT